MLPLAMLIAQMAKQKAQNEQNSINQLNQGVQYSQGTQQQPTFSSIYSNLLNMR